METTTARSAEFIEKNMRRLQKKSKCAAIVPMSLVTSNETRNLEYQSKIPQAANIGIGSLFGMFDESFKGKINTTKGELKDYVKVNSIKWKNQIIKENEIDYWFQPWEIEAHGMEKGLYVKFIEYNKKSNKL